MANLIPNSSPPFDSAQGKPVVPLEQDILEELLRDKRSPNTRRTYAKGLKDFFMTMTRSDPSFGYAQEPSSDLRQWFLSLQRFQALSLRAETYRDTTGGSPPRVRHSANTRRKLPAFWRSWCNCLDG